jgi:hypothetical protein
MGLTLQTLALTAACSIAATAALGCTPVNPPSAGRKADLVRIQRSFERMKAFSQARQNARQTKDDAPTTPPASMVGMWMTTFTDSTGEVVDAGYDIWHSDGTQILNDITPPVAGNVCIGIWQQTDKYTYVLNHPSWAFDPDTNMNLVGTAYILETVTLDPGGDSFTGKFSFEGYDLDGNHVFHQEGVLTGERVKQEPPADAGPLPEFRVAPFVKKDK